MAEKDTILVIDFGGQYAQLISRRVRELGVYSEVVQHDAPVEKFKKAKGIILSGSPLSITDLKALNFNKKILQLGIPVFGMCYGHQMIARELGGKINSSKSKEFGKAKMKIFSNKTIFSGIKDNKIVWMSHHDEVIEVPDGFKIIGSTSDCEVAAMADDKRRIYGFQFHPEVTHTVQGQKIISNFVLEICKAKKQWSIKNYLNDKVKEIKKKVGKKKVLMLVSGGVDSTVCLALLSKALPNNQIKAFHFDTGFMRKNESLWVKKELTKRKFAELHIINAQNEFFNALKGVVDPEKKRQIIGRMFIEIQHQRLKDLGVNTKEWMLGQGTIYPDKIESAGTKLADKIKTHHNRVKEVTDLMKKGLVLEPLDELYKDEVRELGLKLGLSKKLVFRQPFPGPGLAIRCLCSDGKALKSKQQKEISSLLKKFKAKGIVLPLKSVGVQGDLRTYRKPLLLTTNEKNYSKLEDLSTFLTNNFNELNRVVLTVNPSKVSKVKVLKKTLTLERIKLLQEADVVAQNEINKANLGGKIWQFPVVLLPLAVNGKKGESIVLRPIESREAMTAGFYNLPSGLLKKISSKIMKIKGIDAVFFDLTNKPPATIEWE